ncbi:MAG TPA: exodeoxyribonuclease VII small subunit [Chloroflexota bacterium]|nr:exodeoxyribonuclease VII small subunit [Chloroflexota bacterium]
MASPKAKSDVTFGEAMGKLEQVVRQLEEDEAMGLEQALALYEQGAALAADLQARLTAAKLRLTEIAVPASSDEPDA